MISLPWPSAALSGHNKGSWYTKRETVKKHRAWAYAATLANKPVVPGLGDIPIHFRFVPPDLRSDRMNFANRLKPYADGIAEALGVNDIRFLPSFEFCEPEKPGRIEVFIGLQALVDKPLLACRCACNGVERERPGQGVSAPAGPDHNRLATGGD